MWYSDCQNKKNSICTCSIVSRVSIDGSNEPPCGNLIVKIKETQFAHAQ